jgi:flagellar hook-associated protein 1 FlgK
MSLYSTLQIANNALTAQQLGLQVTSNNIANANTPGYVREQVIFSPAPTSRQGGVLVGLGVEVNAIIQKTDRFLEERLRVASADVAYSESQETIYSEIESLIGELGGTDISSSMTRFFNSIHDILNQPESLSTRNVAIQQGIALTNDIRRLDQRTRDVRSDVNLRVVQSANNVNELTRKIADLNVKIVSFEGGGTSPSDAVGLRDERSNTVNELAKLIGVTTVEQTDGSLSVFVGGDYLVLSGVSRDVGVAYGQDRGLSTAFLRIVETDSLLAVTTGEVAGQTIARDEFLGGFLDQLNGFARALIQEFNRVFSSSQGLSGYARYTSEFAVSDTNAALDAASLPFAVENGSFDVHVFNRRTGQTTTTTVPVRLHGMDDDSSLQSLADTLAAIDGLDATISSDRKLQLSSEGANFEFTFAEDTSGLLSALGINSFFSGSSSSDIGVNQLIKDDPGKFAVSAGGIAADTENGVKLAAFLNRPLDSQGDASLAALYENMVGDISQGAANSKASADGFRVFHATLESQFLAIASVNLDEEAVRVITYQRAYQASARLIKTIDDLLESLVNL